MSTRELCPGCDAHTSDIWNAFAHGLPCPYCGLPAQAAEVVMSIRARRGDEQLKADLEAMFKRAVAAETERDELKRRQLQAQEALAGELT